MEVKIKNASKITDKKAKNDNDKEQAATTDEPDKNKVQDQQQMEKAQSNEAIMNDDKDPSTILLYNICYTLNILPSSSKNYNVRKEGKRVERLRDYIYIFRTHSISYLYTLYNNRN